MIEVIDNFLPEKEFKEIQNVICSDSFPFFYSGTVADDDDPPDQYYFIHLFFIHNAPNSSYFNMWDNFLKKINCKALIRIKGNMYIGNQKKQIHKAHRDYDYPHKGCLFYINTNNGATIFEGKEVLPKENRVVFFEPHKPHSSSICTDQNRRITINFNYF